MIVKTECANFSFKEIGFDPQADEEYLKIIPYSVNNETVYWYKSVKNYARTFEDQNEVNKLIEYLDSFPKLFSSNFQIEEEDGQLNIPPKFIYLNKAIIEIPNCTLEFEFIGQTKLIE